MISVIRIFLYIIIFSFLFKTLPVVAVSLTPEQDEAFLKHTPDEELKRLNRYIKSNTSKKKILLPFVHALEGEIAIKKEHMITANTKLRSALTSIDGVLGRKLLKLLLENESKRLSYTKKNDKKLISHMMKLHKKKKIIIFSEMKHYSSKKVRRLLSRLAPDLVAPSVEAKIIADMPPPSAKQMTKDPKFDKTADNYCESNRSLVTNNKWKTWLDALDPVQKAYWKARTLECSGQGQEAVEIYLDIATRYKNSDEHWGFALWAAKRAVMWQRRNAQRKKAAKNYKLLAELWIENTPHPSDFGLTKAALYREKANDLLWAARYRALNGYYDEALRYCELALKTSSKGLNTVGKEIKVKNDLLEYRIEGFQTPADRVLVEKGDFEEARNLILKAKKEKIHQRVWSDRLSWYDGFYAYLNGDLKASTSALWQLQKTTKDDGTRAKAMFWRARSLKKLNKLDEANQLVTELTMEFPLSYYSVVAAPMVFENVKDWREPFRNLKKLRKKLENPEVFKLKSFKHVEDGILLAETSYALLEAKLLRYAKDTSLDLYNRTKLKISLLKRPEVFIYLSRILYASGNYLWAIVVSNQLQEHYPDFWKKWPEQILVFFPQPHLTAFNSAAKSSSLPESLLYSISRQESAFNEKAVSPANAYGLMQLIIPTAKSMAKKMNYATTALKETLLIPAENIKFGAKYLSLLGRRYENVGPLVYAAYNAGEGAVDNWMERRVLEDKLSWIEAIPYGETRGYVKNVARNMAIYSHLLSSESAKNKLYTTSRFKRAVMKGLKRRTFNR